MHQEPIDKYGVHFKYEDLYNRLLQLLRSRKAETTASLASETTDVSRSSNVQLRLRRTSSVVRRPVMRAGSRPRSNLRTGGQHAGLLSKLSQVPKSMQLLQIRQRRRWGK